MPMQAEKLVLMTDVQGVLHNYKDPSTLYTQLDIRACRNLTQEGVISGGMIPKVWGKGVVWPCGPEITMPVQILAAHVPVRLVRGLGWCEGMSMPCGHGPTWCVCVQVLNAAQVTCEGLFTFYGASRGSRGG